MNALKLTSRGVEQTLAIGRALGGAAQSNDVIAISGPLGAGKTVLVKGIAAGLGVQESRMVNSPTYVIVNEYDGRLHVYHVDVYRLGSPNELAALGFDEMCSSGGVVVVEWAERVRDLLPVDHLAISVQPSGQNERELTVRCGGPAAEELLEVLREYEHETARGA